MKAKSFLKASAIALSIVTVSGIPATPLGSSAMAESTISLAGDQDAKAVKVLDKSIEALGGREQIEKIKYITQKGTISIPSMGLEGTIQTSIVSPNKLRLEIDLPMMGKTIQGLNDGIVWSSDAMSGPRIVPEAEAKPLIQQTDLSFQLKYLETYPTIEYIEETEFDGQAAHKLRLVDKDGTESITYYSTENGYQIGTEAEVDTPMGKIISTTIMSGYKKLGGLIQPTKILQKVGPTEIVVIITDSSSEEIDDSVFELPAAIVALIEASAPEEKAAP